MREIGIILGAVREIGIILVGGMLIAHFVLIGRAGFIEGYYRKSFSESFPEGSGWLLLTLVLITVMFTISLGGLFGYRMSVVLIMCGVALVVALLVNRGMKGIGSKVKDAKEKSKEAKEKSKEAKDLRIEHNRRMSELRTNLKQWHVEGYSNLKDIIAIKNFDQMEQKFSDVERKIKTLKTVESTLNKLSQDFPNERAVFELEMESIRKKYKDLSNVDEVESEIENLVDTLTEYRRGKDEILDRIAEVVK